MEPTSYRSYTSLYRVSLSRDILQYFPGPIVFKKHLGVLKNSFITERSRSNSLEKFWFLRIWENRSTVEPRFNEVPRDWGNLFVISRVRYIKGLEQFNEFSKKQPKCSIYRGIVDYEWQSPAFQDLNNYCNNTNWSLTPMSQCRAVYCYGTRNSRTGKQNCLKLL